MVKWVEIGDAKLALGDCRDILPTLGPVDAVVTDPPYGIGADASMAKASGFKGGAMLAAKSQYAATDWDSSAVADDLMAMVRAAGRWNIIFGGNYYALPASSCWLVWDKLNGANDFADCELAWTNLPKAVRRIRHMWNGMLRKGQEERHGHPTQKPVEVMVWSLGQLPVESRTIIDPFMGSGTTGVACALTDRAFIGIERDPTYFDIACRRIEAAYKQPRLFDEPPPKPVQPSLLED